MRSAGLRRLAITGALACATGCRLSPPDVTPIRMIEPRLIEPSNRPATTTSISPVPVRLLSTQARGHIGRRLLYQRAGGELVEDQLWRWSSAPDRYLDSALRLALAAHPQIRLADAGTVPVMAATLLEWHLVSGTSTELAGAVELEITATDRTVRTYLLRGVEQASPDLPGNLADAAGRLLQRLAAQSVDKTMQALR